MRECSLHILEPENCVLEAALCGPGFSSDRHDKLVLESKESMKKRGLHSPDDADALFLTFAQDGAIVGFLEPHGSGR